VPLIGREKADAVPKIAGEGKRGTSAIGVHGGDDVVANTGVVYIKCQMGEYDPGSIGRPMGKARKAVVGQLHQPRTIDVDYVQIRKPIAVGIECPEAENDALTVGGNAG